MYTLYKHTAPNGKVYIGITSRKPETRWENGKGYKCNKHFYNAIILFGWNKIKHEVLAQNLTKEEAEKLEIETIQKYDSTNKEKGYNLRKGGSASSFSDVSLEKMRNSHLGKTLPQEQKDKISRAMKGRKVSKGTLGCKYSTESKAKISKALRGRTKSAETKAKVSASRKGKCTGSSNHRARRVINLSTNEEFETIASASKKYNISHSCIVRSCNSNKKAGGYKWEYV